MIHYKNNMYAVVNGQSVVASVLATAINKMQIDSVICIRRFLGQQAVAPSTDTLCTNPAAILTMYLASVTLLIKMFLIKVESEANSSSHD